MSMVICEQCERWIDSDEDGDCFVETGNMRRLHQTTVLCEACRDRMYDHQQAQEAADKS